MRSGELFTAIKGSKTALKVRFTHSGEDKEITRRKDVQGRALSLLTSEHLRRIGPPFFEPPSGPSFQIVL
jgi:hypothetical protein